MKIIYNKLIPFGRYTAINICGILFTKKKELSAVSINHEKIHTAQMKEMGYIGFYLWYAIEGIITYFANRLDQYKGYRDISFEEEAYNNQDNLDYLKNRKHYAWCKYLKLRSNNKSN